MRRSAVTLLAVLALAAPAALTGCPGPGGTVDSIITGATESFEPSGRTWTAQAGMPAPHTPEVAALAANGLAYVFGGRSSAGDHPATLRVDAYDPAADAWTRKHDLPSYHYRGRAHAIGGLVYVVGGSDETGYPGLLDAYDPAADTFTACAAEPDDAVEVPTVVAAGTLFAVGTYDTRTGVATGGVYAYDPVGDTWTAQPAMPTPRLFATVVSDGAVIYAIGGAFSDQDAIEDTVEMFDPLAATWTALPSIPERTYDKRTGVAVGGPGADIAVLGFDRIGLAGLGGVDDDYRLVDRYSVASDAWTAPPDLPLETDRQGFLFALGRLWVAGGHPVTEDDAGFFRDDESHASGAVASYDPAADAWRTEPFMPTRRERPFLFAANGRIYVVGGVDVIID